MRKTALRLLKGILPWSAPVSARMARRLPTRPTRALWEAGDDEAARAVKERDGDGLGIWKVRVCLLDVFLEDGLLETRDGQHWSGLALTTFDGVLYERRVDSESGEELLAALTDVEEELERLGDIGVERFETVGGGENDGRDDTLGVTGGALDLRAELGGSKTRGTDADEELSDLRQTDQGQAERHAGEIRDRRLRSGTGEPTEHIEAVGVVAGETLLDGILDELVKHGLRRFEQRRYESSVSVEESLQLLEVSLSRWNSMEEVVSFLLQQLCFSFSSIDPRSAFCIKRSSCRVASNWRLSETLSLGYRAFRP